MKNNIFLLIAASIFILSFSSCDDLLDVTPKDKITPETFFSTEADLQAFSTNFYNSLPKDRDLYKDDADNITHSTPNSAATDSRTVPASGGGWEWGYLRRFNTLLQYSVNCKDKTVRTRYQALTRFFRAYFYFEMVKRFGDIPWYDTELFVSETDQLNKPRDAFSCYKRKANYYEHDEHRRHPRDHRDVHAGQSGRAHRHHGHQPAGLHRPGPQESLRKNLSQDHHPRRPAARRPHTVPRPAHA